MVENSTRIDHEFASTRVLLSHTHATVLVDRRAPHVAAASRVEWDARLELPPGRTDRPPTWDPAQPWTWPATEAAPGRVFARPMLAAAAILGSRAAPPPSGSASLGQTAAPEEAASRPSFAPSDQTMSLAHRRAEPPRSFSPADIQRLTDQIVRVMDQRLVAHRERFGRT